MDASRQRLGEPPRVVVGRKLGPFLLAPLEQLVVIEDHQPRIAVDDAEPVLDGNLVVRLAEQRQRHVEQRPHLLGIGSRRVHKHRCVHRDIATVPGGHAYTAHPAAVAQHLLYTPRQQGRAGGPRLLEEQHAQLLPTEPPAPPCVQYGADIRG